MNHKLTSEEQIIEDNLDNFKSVSDEKRSHIESIIETTKKNKAISMRMSAFDLELLKQKAQREGMPYQTLLNTIVHKYVTNQLVDKNEVIKTITMMKENEAI
ncbi:CopG family antitoxin [Desulfonatronovibrio magnus]|uniref:CopG family antitoxin n=1 Tax=Desulfonatronovibrio magnus TaxID=698827 RepID=UPI0005EB7E23|nr:CopG family antitoxin [Desulfonatronovibrio magnus]